MDTLKQLAFLFALYLGAVWLAERLPFPFPASVLGMLLLLALLLAGALKPRQVELGADLLLKNMMFLFVPAGVSILEYYPLIRDKVPQLVFIALATLVITLAAAALTVQGVSALMRQKKEAKE